MRRAWLGLLLVACCSTAHVKPGHYRDEATRTMVEASVRVIITCDGGVVGFGSGVAISPTHVLTARHVAFPQIPPELACKLGFSAVTFEGLLVPMEPDKQAATGVDAATLKVVGPAYPFRVFAVRGEDAAIGETVHVCAGRQVWERTPEASFNLKPLTVAGYYTLDGSRYVAVSGHVVAGNSGAALWNDRGEVVGVVVRSLQDPAQEEEGLAVRTDELDALF